MARQGLKLRISFTFFGLLAIGMLLVNLVVSAFWQRDLVKTQVDSEKNNLRIWGKMMQRTRPSVSSESLLEIQRLAGKRFINIAFYDGQSLMFADDLDNKKLGELVMMAASGHGDLVQFSGTDLGLIFPEQGMVRIAVYLNPGKAVGSSIHLHSVYQMIGENQRLILVYIIVNAIVLTVIGFLRMANMILRPIDRLVKMTETYSVSESDFIFSLKAENEFGTLALSLSSLLKKIEEDRRKLRTLVSSLELANEQLRSTQKEMIVAEKMAAIGLLSAGIAHEIGNPLSIVQGYIELLADRELSEEDAKQFSLRAMYELDRISTLIRQLLSQARATSKDIIPASLSTLLYEVIEAVKSQKSVGKTLIEIDCEFDREIIINDGSGLRQVFLNCLLNALDAINEHSDVSNGLVVVSCSEDTQRLDGRYVLITIGDNGAGMTETELMSAFDPFFTTKSQGRGTGLGLFVSYAVIEAMKGRMWIESSFGKGTVVYIEIPI